MIKKLQRKLKLITMISVTLVLVLIVGVINFFNFYQVNQSLDDAIKLLTDNRGVFPDFDKKRQDIGDSIFSLPVHADTPFETRYFIIELDSDGGVIRVDTSHIAAISSADALEYADKAINSGSSKGFVGSYRYGVKEDNQGSLVVFVNGRNQLHTAVVSLMISGIAAAVILLVVFALVLVLSKRLMRPINDSIERQKQFIADTGYELMNPIAIILANADVLDMNFDKNEWMEGIRDQAARMNKLVKNLLTLSQMDEEQQELVFVNFDLSEAVNQVVDSYREKAKKLNKELTVECQPNILLYGDMNGISQIVSILVDNAIKYSIANDTIKISLTASKKEARLQVRNKIESISTNQLSRLFDRFYSTNTSGTRETGSYGLGLSIAKYIAEAHNGRITARREDRRAICFTVILPL